MRTPRSNNKIHYRNVLDLQLVQKSHSPPLKYVHCQDFFLTCIAVILIYPFVNKSNFLTWIVCRSKLTTDPASDTDIGNDSPRYGGGHVIKNE